MDTPISIPTRAAGPTSNQPARHDVYGLIHKGLRSFMLDTLTRLGQLNCASAPQVAGALGQARALLEQLRLHLLHENTFLHTALEVRRPGASVATAVEHADHERAFADLLSQVNQAEGALARGQLTELAAYVKTLYLSLSFFVAENLAHMYREETEITQLLWQLYSDDELRGIEGAIVASETPEEIGVSMRWMLPSITPQERAALLGGAKQALPAPAFAQLMNLARGALAPEQYRELEVALGPAA
jgi:hypothetical protein